MSKVHLKQDYQLRLPDRTLIGHVFYYECDGWYFEFIPGDPEDDRDMEYIEHAIKAWKKWRKYVKKHLTPVSEA